MTWARVVQIYVLLALLAGYVLIVERAPSDVDPKNLPPRIEESLLQEEPTAIVALTFRRDADELHAILGEDGRWQVLRPADVDVPSDLLQAIVGTLTAGQASEVMAADAGTDLTDFGLLEPSTEIEITLRGQGQAIRLQLGAPNPTGTALYARRSDRDAVYLVGLNVRYYTDLVLAGMR